MGWDPIAAGVRATWWLVCQAKPSMPEFFAVPAEFLDALEQVIAEDAVLLGLVPAPVDWEPPDTLAA
jgi:hypothetical protein